LKLFIHKELKAKSKRAAGGIEPDTF